MLTELNSDNGHIFRITHIRNMSWIFRNGLHCHNAGRIDPQFISIGNPDLITKRRRRAVPIEPRGTLPDYIPFYFTPLSPMLYNILTGYGDIRQRLRSDIAIIVTSLPRLYEFDTVAVYTDRHAYLRTANFFSSLDDLDKISWGPLRRRDFSRDVNDPQKIEKYQAEALVHRHLPVEQLSEVVCYNEDARASLEAQSRDLDVNIEITINRRWYF